MSSSERRFGLGGAKMRSSSSVDSERWAVSNTNEGVGVLSMGSSILPTEAKPIHRLVRGNEGAHERLGEAKGTGRTPCA